MAESGREKYAYFNKMSSEDLVYLWNAYDKQRYSESDFSMIRSILESRGYEFEYDLEEIREQERQNIKLTGIRGWLIVAAIGLVLTIILELKTAFVVVYALTVGDITIPESGYFFLFLSSAYIVFLLFLAVIFFMRKRVTPFFFIILHVITLCLYVTSLIIGLIAKADIYWLEWILRVFISSVWIGYWLVSKRVKLTFTRKMINHLY